MGSPAASHSGLYGLMMEPACMQAVEAGILFIMEVLLLALPHDFYHPLEVMLFTEIVLIVRSTLRLSLMKESHHNTGLL